MVTPGTIVLRACNGSFRGYSCRFMLTGLMSVDACWCRCMARFADDFERKEELPCLTN